MYSVVNYNVPQMDCVIGGNPGILSEVIDLIATGGGAAEFERVAKSGTRIFRLDHLVMYTKDVPREMDKAILFIALLWATNDGNKIGSSDLIKHVAKNRSELRMGLSVEYQQHLDSALDEAQKLLQPMQTPTKKNVSNDIKLGFICLRLAALFSGGIGIEFEDDNQDGNCNQYQAMR